MNTALIVEDSLTALETISECLSEHGFRILTAQSGEEAEAKIQQDKPDIIILDVLLPGRSGFEFCRQFKTTAETNQIPIILCSSKGTQLDQFWGKKQGADAYILKPVNPEILINTVKKLLAS